jgi:MATE family multidrug resistance protein
MIAALFQLSDGIQVSTAGALRGFEDTATPMLINLIAYWVIGLPLAAYLAFNRNLDAYGLWLGLICGLTVAAFLLVRRFCHLKEHI